MKIYLNFTCVWDRQSAADTSLALFGATFVLECSCIDCFSLLWFLIIFYCLFATLPFQVKQQENEAALLLLSERLKELDALPWEKRQCALVEGILAGNVFDWGAKEVAE